MTRRMFAPLCAFLLCISTLAPPLFAQTTERHVLFEEFSTARCGFCPDGTLKAAAIVRDHPSVIWVTHHAGFGVDSMTTPESAAIAGAFTNFAPGACIDRGVYPEHVSPYIEEYGKIATTRSKWDSVVTTLLDNEQYAALTIASSYDAQTMRMDVTVDAEFTTLPPAGDIRMNLFIVEDSVVGYGTGYDQKNYYNGTTNHPLYQAGDPIVGYAHHRVVSGVPTGAWGAEGIIPANPQTGTTYTYTYSGPLTDVWDASNMNRPDIISLVAFLSYYDSDPLKRQVIHAAEAPLSVVSTTHPLAQPRIALSVEASPNPARGEVRFLTRLASVAQGILTVTDFTGRTVATYTVPRGTQRFRLSTDALPAGIYFYRLTAGIQGSSTWKVMVLH